MRLRARACSRGPANPLLVSLSLKQAANALLFQIFYTLIYVVPFYLSSRTRPSPNLSRDAPSVIRARITSVTLTCVVCSALTFYILTAHGHASSQSAAHIMGYWPVGLVAAARVLLLTGLLFAGPLFEHLVVEGGWRAWLGLAPLKELLGEWTTWRNIVAVCDSPFFFVVFFFGLYLLFL